MQHETSEQVALFIDFENLVFGLENQYGADYPAELDPELLFRLAEEYGQIVLANAYADWRNKHVNQFQMDLYKLGIDLMHVFGTRFKNSVDVKMAIDAVEILWTLPQVNTFVIVSGDRDFIHLLKMLRRYGRTVIGVSPDNSVSSDFAALCDRFIRYDALARTFDGGAEDPDPKASQFHSLEEVRDSLQSILSERKSGVKGALLKPLLRRSLSASFDESEYGFSRFADLLHAMPDIVKVVPNPNGGDIVVYHANSDTDDLVLTDEGSPGDSTLVERAGLRQYKFEANPKKRRDILVAMYEEICAETPFTWAKVFKQILEREEDLPVSLSILSKYQSVLWQSRIFSIGPDQQEMSAREKLMTLDDSITNVDEFIYRYEGSIAYKLRLAGSEMGHPLTASTLAEILRLDPEADDAYIQRLLRYNS